MSNARPRTHGAEAWRIRWSRREVRVVFYSGAVIVAVWLASRIFLATRFPLYGDEGIFESLTQLVWSNPEQRFVALTGNKGLLATWITAAFMGLGVSPFTAVRGFAVVCGFVTLAATTSLSWRTWGPRVAVVVAAVMTLLPYMLLYDIVAQYDPFIAAVAMVALLLQVELAARPRLDIAMLLGFALGAGLMTKQSGVFAVLLLPLSLLLFDWSPQERWRRLASWVGCTAVALVIAGLMYSIQYASPAAYLPVVENHRLFRDAILHPLRYMKVSWKPYLQTFVGYLTVPLLLPLAAGVWRAFVTKPRFAAILVGWVVVPALAALLIATVPVARYTVQCVPPLAIAIGLGLVYLYDEARRSLRHLTTIVSVLGLLFLPALVFDGLLLAKPTAVRYPGMDDWQYMRSEQLAGPPLEPVVAAIRAHTKRGQRTTVASYNSFNVGEMDAVLNGRRTGNASPYIVGGWDPAAQPPDQRFLLVERVIPPPYFDWGTPLDELIGSPNPVGRLDSRYALIKPYLRRYQLILRVERPRNGPTVYLYERK
jgi:dolichyl-phosphate-mannose-protein mannosyltransferase